VYHECDVTWWFWPLNTILLEFWNFGCWDSPENTFFQTLRLRLKTRRKLNNLVNSNVYFWEIFEIELRFLLFLILNMEIIDFTWKIFFFKFSCFRTFYTLKNLMRKSGAWILSTYCKLCVRDLQTSNFVWKDP
jgi:hypothetical protein